MDRRGFLASLLGLAAAAALPAQAEAVLQKLAHVPDEQFAVLAPEDTEIIDLIRAYIRAASMALAKKIDQDIYNAYVGNA